METLLCQSQLPCVLLVTTRRWHFAARLAMRFAQAGCEVDIVCPRLHSVRLTSAVRTMLVYRALRPHWSIRRAIQMSTPRLLVPCDDDATTVLQQIYMASKDDTLRKLITDSIGPESSFGVTQARVALHKLAVSLGIPVPQAADVQNKEDVERCLTLLGLPAYLKTDGSSGGNGVRWAGTALAAHTLYQKLATPPSLLRAFKRAAIDGDHSLLLAALKRHRSGISLHQAVNGQEANHSVFCWRGEVQASITMKVVVASRETGPSTVVRHCPNPAIQAAVVALVRRLQLSGFFGFDFIVASCPITGKQTPYLIEMNARATPTSHLALGQRNDLIAAAVSSLTADEIRPESPVTTNPVIALFPGELLRDPTSQYLHTAYHDLPHSEPALIVRCMEPEAAWKQWFTYRTWRTVSSRFIRSNRRETATVEQLSELDPAPPDQSMSPALGLSYPEGTEIA